MSNILEDFVKDKRVIICGPAPYLQGQDKYSWIDDHDIIVRPNQFHIPENLISDYGSRTDIMSHNFGTPWMKGLKEDIENNKDQFDKLQMLICPLLYGTRNKEENYMSWPENHIGDVVYNAESINSNKIPFYWIGVKKYQQLYRDMGCQPYSGVLTIMMLLECRVKSLTVTGFDFYETATAYADGLHNPTNGDPPMQGGGHGNAIQQAKYVKSVYDKTENFYVDDKLQSIFDKL